MNFKIISSLILPLALLITGCNPIGDIHNNELVAIESEWVESYNDAETPTETAAVTRLTAKKLGRLKLKVNNSRYEETLQELVDLFEELAIAWDQEDIDKANALLASKDRIIEKLNSLAGAE